MSVQGLRKVKSVLLALHKSDCTDQDVMPKWSTKSLELRCRKLRLAIQKMPELMRRSNDIVTRSTSSICRQGVALIHGEQCVNRFDPWSVLHAAFFEHCHSPLSEL